MTDPNRKSLGALLLHGGDWHGIRVMGLGERLAVIGVSAAVAIPTALWLAPKIAEHAFRHAAGYFPSRREMRSDPGRHDGNDNRRDGGRENRVEALEKPSSGAPSAFIELTPSTIGEAGDGCFDGNAIFTIEDSTGNEAVTNQFGGNPGIVTKQLNGKRAFGDAVEDASVLRVHTEILTQPESARQRQADNSN